MAREHEDKMTAWLGSPQGASGFPPVEHYSVPAGQAPVRVPRPEFRVEIKAADGTPLLVMREDDGYLVIEGDESRWTEGAMRFLQQMRQWSGQVGLRWQDEVQKTADGA